MDSTTSGWESAAGMLWWHGYAFDMVALGGRAYAVGGYRDYTGNDIDIELMERYDENTNSWTQMASYPYYVHYQCMVADEETGRIWSMGGQHRGGSYRNSTSDRSEVYYYQVKMFRIIIGFAGVEQLVAPRQEHDLAPAAPLLWHRQDVQ